MSTPSFIDRRDFVAGCVGAAGVLLLPSADAAIEPQPSSGITVIVDPAIEESDAFGVALSRHGGEHRALCGDRYRFIRDLRNAGASSITIAGMGTYADFIVITDALREARYAMVSYGLHPLSRPTEHRCFGRWSGCEPTLRRSVSRWPAALADVTAGRLANETLSERPVALREARSGTLLSWVMQSRSRRRIA